MPILVELERGSQCSFFSFCSLDELKSSVEDDAAQIIDVFVDVSTLSRFNNASTITTTSTSVTSIAAKPEQFFYPSSFMFEFFVAFDNCFVHANHLGLQRKVRRKSRMACFECGKRSSRPINYQSCFSWGTLFLIILSTADQEAGLAISNKSLILSDLP